MLNSFSFDYTHLSALICDLLLWHYPLNSIVVCLFFRACHRLTGMCLCTFNMSCFLWLIMSSDCHGRSTVPSLHSDFLLLVSMNGINLTLREKLIQSSIYVWWIMVCYSYTTLSAWQKVIHYLLLVCVCVSHGSFLVRKKSLSLMKACLLSCTIQCRIVVYIYHIFFARMQPYTYG